MRHVSYVRCICLFNYCNLLNVLTNTRWAMWITELLNSFHLVFRPHILLGTIFWNPVYTIQLEALHANCLYFVCTGSFIHICCSLMEREVGSWSHWTQQLVSLWKKRKRNWKLNLQVFQMLRKDSRSVIWYEKVNWTFWHSWHIFYGQSFLAWWLLNGEVYNGINLEIS